MNQRILEKLKLLADAAKYDVSCASSGSKRKNVAGGLGNATGMGICHSYTEDGRCVSLLKVLMTNYCIYDCAYCVSRRSNDVKRVAFTVQEIVDLTINFYKRNYIEGLFLSSGIFKNGDYTNERLVRVAKKLREEHNFHGYIHLKIIPGASHELTRKAGLYADRLSINLELPSEKSLRLIAPEKSHQEVYPSMNYLKEAIAENRSDRKKIKRTPLFTPAGQSTQLVIGATPETDYEVLHLSNALYRKQQLRRVYYSGYIPVGDNRLLPDKSPTPLIRENRLYQADWLLRFYGFDIDEIVDAQHPNLDMEIDPKLGYALRNYHLFPVDINHADYEMILKIPGIGVKSASMIVQARRHGKIQIAHLRKMGVALKRAKYFIMMPTKAATGKQLYPERIRNLLAAGHTEKAQQLRLF